jgi:PhnB protein
MAQAADAGAVVLREPADQFYGDRAGMVADPYGHQWSLHTRLVDMTPEEMDAAMAEMMANMTAEG